MKRIWKTKTGGKIRIKDMSTEHIKNCIKLLERYNTHRLHNLLSFQESLVGKQAIIHCENCIEEVLENGWEDKSEEYILSFEKELEKRTILNEKSKS